MTVQASRRQRPLSKGVPRQWRGMYNAGGASIYCKSPFIIWTFCICFPIHTPRLRRTPLKRGLAVAVRLSLLEKTIWTFCICFRYIPPGFAVPLSRGDSRWQSDCLCLSIICVEVAALRTQMTIQASRLQPPMSTRMPRLLRYMSHARAASIYCKSPF